MELAMALLSLYLTATSGTDWWGCSPCAAETSKFLCHRNQVDNVTCRLGILNPLKEQLYEFLNLKKYPNLLSLAQLCQASENILSYSNIHFSPLCLPFLVKEHKIC